MKRILSILLILSVLCSFPASAFAKNDYEFVFRNGIKWGMSESEILNLEGRIEDPFNFMFESELPGGHICRQLMLTVGDYGVSDLYYRLFDDSLFYAAYLISFPEYFNIDDVVSELTGEYGDETPIGKDTKAELFLKNFGFDLEAVIDASSVRELMNDPAFNAVAETMHYWMLPDGTEIFIGADYELQSDFTTPFICYWNSEYGIDLLSLLELINSESTPTPQPTPSPQPESDRVTLEYKDGREVSYSLEEMHSALGGDMVLLRNSCMYDETDCDMTPVYEAMDFAVLNGATIINNLPLTQEQFETAHSWVLREREDLDWYSWEKNYFKMLFPTVYWFRIDRNPLDGICSINIALDGGFEYTTEERALAVAKGREAALQIVKNMPASCNTDFKKLEYLYDYMTHYVKYYDGAGGGSGYYDISKEHRHLLYDALVTKETVCAGFAYSFAYLCELAGIDAQYVVGHTESNPYGTTHAAVIAEVDGNCHWFDPTWDCGKDQIKDGFQYFGLSDSEMRARHEYSITSYPRDLYPDCPYGISGVRSGYWDFDTMTYRPF